MQGHVSSEGRRGLVRKPAWVEAMEARIAAAVPLRPNLISGAKLFVIAPLIVMSMRQVAIVPDFRWLTVACFLLFGALDYLDGVVARQKHLESLFGRLFDRITDFPVLVIIALPCFSVHPGGLLVAKLMLDFVLLVQFIFGIGTTENRIRTGMNYTTLFAMLVVSQGLDFSLVTPELVFYLLWANIVFSVVVVLYNFRILQKRFIADALSGANLLCGVFSMVFAARGHVEVSLLFLMLGAAFDGFDGAAARKFGGTRWGVYSDDIADGVNYGIAPGVALYCALGGVQGAVVGIFYTCFTIGRLVYFTRNKKNSDPGYFCGAPSTMGALVTLCSVILFKGHMALAGFMTGIACIQMVSFDTHYKHLGRALSSNRRIIYGMPALIVVLLAGNIFVGITAPVAVILSLCLLYGFIPTIMSFKRIFAPASAMDI